MPFIFTVDNDAIEYILSVNLNKIQRELLLLLTSDRKTV